ncbi:MAG TPA: DinB family protein [Candidatus Acidoferrales bacterium]|nr:DinB family protein [Candidatus Acidoferrales bacterium]
MPTIDPILMEIEQESKVTQRVLDRVPEDKLTWKPHPRSSSLGQLALHIAVGQGRLAEILAKDTHEIGIISQPQPASRKEILEAFSQNTAAALETLKKLSDSQLVAVWTLTKGGKVVLSAPRVGVIRSILMNHFYHHRGQLSVYLRMLEVPVPSIYGPSADENPFA